MSYVEHLEQRLSKRSDELEEKHFDAAMDAQISVVGGIGSKSNPIFSSYVENSTKIKEIPNHECTNDKDYNDYSNPNKNSSTNINHYNKDIDDSTSKKQSTIPIFDNYSNPDSVHNCLSPYVPSASDRIKAFIDLVNLKKGDFYSDNEAYNGDILLDIGCGDGRVCIASAKMTGCKAIGLDVSPLCIAMAKKVATEEDVGNGQCSFYELDATIHPDQLLSDKCPIEHQLKTVTVIFLYTYPTLLMKLIPLLARLTDGTQRVRKVVTLTYHLPISPVTDTESSSSEPIHGYGLLEDKNDEYDICIYSKIFNKS